MKPNVATPDCIMQLGHAFQGSKTLLSAVELGVFTALAHGPLELDTLRDQLGINERGVRDFLDALVALGMLTRHEDGRYSNTIETDLYLDRNKPTYVGGLLEGFNTRHYGNWGSLTTALRTGKPQSGTRGTGNYPALYADQSRLENFVSGMTARTRPVANALAVKFPWANHRTFIDIGTAEGCLPVEIAQTHPHVTGGGFDLPEARLHFESHVQKHGLSNRLRFCSGDFFADALPSADVLVMGRVLHNWDLATKKMLLQKAFVALPPGGVLIVYERLIDDERRVNAAGLLSSLNMLVNTAGGFDSTGVDYIGWMRDTGFRDMRIEPLTAEQSMVVGVR
ncbi:MAG: methyltransferase [Betaproteobacteria bacterium]|nr:methyltransferase [Betaproteobacteria bacterium]